MLTISQAKLDALADDHFKARLLELLRRNCAELVNGRSDAELGPLVQRAIAFARAHGARSERELAECAVLSLITGEGALSMGAVSDYLAVAGDAIPIGLGGCSLV
jgi:hypothetical protein